MRDRPLTPRERLRVAAAYGLARLPAPLLVRLSGRPPVVVDGQTLDPLVQLVLAVRRRRGQPGLCEPSPPEARARFRREVLMFERKKTPVGAVRDLEIEGGGPLRVRHYAPEAPEGPEPLLVYLHGGGFVIGDLDTYDEPCRLLCRHARTHVLSVDYRLAPEHPFPAALDDARKALRWAQDHAAALGAAPARVAIGGDSAGGNLAAGTARLAAREGRPPAAQLLLYPATDSVTDRPSRTLFDRGYFLSRADRTAFWAHYLRGTGVDNSDPRVSPLLAPDLGGLPPALVVTAGFDVLRDEGEAYAEALHKAGTPAVVRRVPDLGHGFIHMTGLVPAARRAVVDLARAWRRLIEASPSTEASPPEPRVDVPPLPHALALDEGRSSPALPGASPPAPGWPAPDAP